MALFFFLLSSIAIIVVATFGLELFYNFMGMNATSSKFWNRLRLSVPTVMFSIYFSTKIPMFI